MERCRRRRGGFERDEAVSRASVEVEDVRLSGENAEEDMCVYRLWSTRCVREDGGDGDERGVRWVRVVERGRVEVDHCFELRDLQGAGDRVWWEGGERGSANGRGEERAEEEGGALSV